MVHSKHITTSKETDVLNASPGMKCSALYKGTKFGVEVIACGKIQLHEVALKESVTKCCGVCIQPCMSRLAIKDP